MANRYRYQFNGSLKPQMNQIEGFVSIGTGGTVNAPLAYPIFPVGTGPTGGYQTAIQTGAPLFLLPGQATGGAPTGWQGGFSGCIGLIGAGVQGVQRVATGLYAIGLQDDWCALDSVQVDLFAGQSGLATGAMISGFSGLYNGGVDWYITQHTVGLGNTIQTGGYTLPVLQGNPKNMIYLQFGSNGPAVDLPAGGGFFLDIRLRDSTAGVH